MLKKEILSSVQCVIPHNCAKQTSPSNKCAQCEIGYSFIAKEPRVLECGHHVCNECIPKIEKRSVNCKTCGKHAKSNGANGVAADSLFQVLKNDLTKELRDKYEATLKLSDERKICMETHHNTIMAYINDEIYLKAEELKKEIDDWRDELLKDLKKAFSETIKVNSGKELKENAAFNEKFKELDRCVQRCQIEKDKFFEYQSFLKAIIDDIQSSYDFKTSIHFKPSTFHFDSKQLLGDLNVKKANYNYSKPTKCRINLMGHIHTVRALALLKNGDLASGSEDCTIKIWNPADGALKKTLDIGSGAIMALVVHLNGNLISGSKDKKIRIFSCDGQLINTLTGHTGEVQSLAVLKNGDIASGSGDYTIKIWSLDGVLKRTLNGHTRNIYRLAGLPNADLVSCSDDKSIKIWSPDGTLKRILLGHTSYMDGLAVLQNGDIATGSNDRTIKVWDGLDGSLKNTFTYHKRDVACLLALPNGDLASSSYDGKIIIADINGVVKVTLTGHSGTIWALQLLPSGELASASDDKTIKIWTA